MSNRKGEKAMKNIDILQDYERYLRNEDRSERTVKTYLFTVKRIQEFILREYEVEIGDDLKGYMISQWVTSIQNLKPTSRALYIVSAGVFLKYLYNMDYVAKDLSAALPKPPSPEKYYDNHPDEHSPKRAYTTEEVQTMLNVPSKNPFGRTRNRAIIAVLVSTGLRVSELCQLNVGDVLPILDCDESATAKIRRKGSHGKLMEIYLSKDLKEYLAVYMAVRSSKGYDCSADSPLFITKEQNRMTGIKVYENLRRIEEIAGVPTGVHTFRHTALSAVSKAVDPVVARDLAGHKRMQVTNRYTHSTREELAGAADTIAELFLGHGKDGE